MFAQRSKLVNGASEGTRTTTAGFDRERQYDGAKPHQAPPRAGILIAPMLAHRPVFGMPLLRLILLTRP
jgi:hypothetical protein